MNKFDSLFDPNLDSEKLDKKMKELLHSKFDNDLKNRYKDILENEYGINRSVETEPPKSDVTVDTKEKNKFSLLFKSGLLILLLLSVWAGYHIFNNNIVSNEHKVEQYLAMNPLNFHEVSRGLNDDGVALRNKAYAEINKSQFVAAISSFGQLQDKTLEDEFFLAYANMATKNYEEAGVTFRKLESEIQPSQKYFEEIKFFSALCKLATESHSAKEILSKLPLNSWSRSELESILSK